MTYGNIILLTALFPYGTVFVIMSLLLKLLAPSKTVWINFGQMTQIKKYCTITKQIFLASGTTV